VASHTYGPEPLAPLPSHPPFPLSTLPGYPPPSPPRTEVLGTNGGGCSAIPGRPTVPIIWVPNNEIGTVGGTGRAGGVTATACMPAAPHPPPSPSPSPFPSGRSQLPTEAGQPPSLPPSLLPCTVDPSPPCHPSARAILPGGGGGAVQGRSGRPHNVMTSSFRAAQIPIGVLALIASCGGPAISLQYTLSLVQLVNYLLPI
jgi:hypothetical protein